MLCTLGRSLSVIVALLQVRGASPGSFTVQVPDKPLVAQLGADLMLPCHLSPAHSAEPLEVRWARKERNEEVHLYRHRTEKQGRAFEGRVSLFKDSLKQGNVSLLIRDLQVSDEGLYTCFVDSGSYYDRGEVEVKISMTGSAPLVSLEGHEGGGIRLSCHSEGWYPAPEVLWADETGAPVPKTRGIFTRSREGLYSVSTHLLLSGQGQAEVSCVLEFGGNGRQIQSRIHVSGAFFTPAQPWFISAVVLVVIFLISLTYVIILKKENLKLVEVLGAEEGQWVSLDRRHTAWCPYMVKLKYISVPFTATQQYV
ncbi:butyrophilin subfamily 3 member A2-like [Lepisosteus oculatus]|uniref:butyrophilin subfamily 3 member A2-like n=1 Tax=Lepisosteus oculatus TaxID=7918 RepID=UPI0035F50789